MKRALAIVTCLAVGHAAAAGFFWGLVNVPESNVAMLALSALLALLLIVTVGWTEASASLGWRADLTMGQAARRGLRAAPIVVAAAVVFAAVWMLTAHAGVWLDLHSGEIDAWILATFESSRTAWVHRALDAILFVVRYVVGVSLAVALLSAGARAGWRAVGRLRWVRAGLSRRQLGLVAAAMILFVFLPLGAVYWHPPTIPANAVELLFVAVKLGTIYLLAQIGWALVLWAGARETAS